MKTPLSEHHPLFNIGLRIREHANDFLVSHNLSYFQFARVYTDGSGFGLSNKPEFILEYTRCIGKTVSAISGEQVDKQCYFYLWDEHFSSEMIQLAQVHGIHKTLGLVERFPTHYNLIAFGRPHQNTPSIEAYLNQLEEMRNFVKGFKKTCKDWLHEAELHRLEIPPSLQDDNHERMFWPKRHIAILYKNMQREISLREYECLHLLMNGLTLKEIASELTLSPRTVETHLENCKTKFDCRDRSNLRDLYLCLGAGRSYLGQE